MWYQGLPMSLKWQGSWPPVFMIVGPTAVGKTQIAMTAANFLGCDIISADSRQIYKLLDIGTAKPTPDEQKAVKHHIIDLIYPDQGYSAADYARDAKTLIDQTRIAGRLPLVVGGSGLYLKAISHSLFDSPPADEDLRLSLKRKALAGGKALLHKELSKVDPQAARRIHPNDSFRIIRALEVYYKTGKPISEHHNEHNYKKAPYPIISIGLMRPWEELDARISQRCRSMFEKGLLNEAKRLLDLGYQEELAPLRSFGYRHAIDCAKGRCSCDEAMHRLIRYTKKFAKRQITWFKKAEGIEWIDISKLSSEESAEVILTKLAEKKEGVGSRPDKTWIANRF